MSDCLFCDSTEHTTGEHENDVLERAVARLRSERDAALTRADEAEARQAENDAIALRAHLDLRARLSRALSSLASMREWHATYHGEDPCSLCLDADGCLTREGVPAPAAHGGERAPEPITLTHSAQLAEVIRAAAPSPEAEGPRCATCGGAGFVKVVESVEPGVYYDAGEPCDACGGTGRSGGKP